VHGFSYCVLSAPACIADLALLNMSWWSSALPVWLHLREMELYAQQVVKTGAPLDTFHHAILPPLIGVLILGVGDSVVRSIQTCLIITTQSLGSTQR